MDRIELNLFYFAQLPDQEAGTGEDLGAAAALYLGAPRRRASKGASKLDSQQISQQSSQPDSHPAKSKPASRRAVDPHKSGVYNTK